MTETPWPDAELAKVAAVADGPADAVIAALVTAVEARSSRQATFPELLREVRRDTNDPDLHPEVGTFVLGGAAIDGVMDKDLVRHAQAFFGENGVAIITALFHAALPEAYLGRRGVQVLDMTGELVSNWSRRIQETGQFLINVMSPAPYLVRLDDSTSLSAGEFGAVAVRRIRLTHAAVRWMLSAPPEWPRDVDHLLAKVSSKRLTRWKSRMIEIGEEEEEPLTLAGRDTAGEAAELAETTTDAVPQASRVTSQPLNQEDLLATLGTFTTVTFAALAKLSVPFDAHDQEAFYHLWNVVAWHLGIGEAQALNGIREAQASNWPENNLLPLGVEELDALYYRLAERLQRPTEQGQRLAKALMQELRYPMPRPLQSAPDFIVRYLIGDEHADQLDIGRGGYAELLIRHTGALERVARLAPSSLVGRATLRPISQLVTRYAMRAFVAQSRGSDRGVAIARPVARTWGIQTGPEVRAPKS